MSFKGIKNMLRKCENCDRYYKRDCLFDGIFPEWWYKNKKCKYFKKYRKEYKKYGRMENEK